MQEIIKGVLRAKLTDAKYSGELGKEIADAVKVEVRGARSPIEDAIAAAARSSTLCQNPVNDANSLPPGSITRGPLQISACRATR